MLRSDVQKLFVLFLGEPQAQRERLAAGGHRAHPGLRKLQFDRLSGLHVAGGTAFVTDTTLGHNLALGGAGADGSDGGNGLGGGVYNDAASSLRLERSTITANHANGGDGGEGGSDGEGIGGGVYNLGAFDLDALTLIFKNHASTSHDDVFDPFA